MSVVTLVWLRVAPPTLGPGVETEVRPLEPSRS